MLPLLLLEQNYHDVTIILEPRIVNHNMMIFMMMMMIIMRLVSVGIEIEGVLIIVIYY